MVNSSEHRFQSHEIVDNRDSLVPSTISVNATLDKVSTPSISRIHDQGRNFAQSKIPEDEDDGIETTSSSLASSKYENSRALTRDDQVHRKNYLKGFRLKRRSKNSHE